MFYLAKFIQAIGFADVGYALLVGLTEDDGLAREYRLMLIGVAIFYLGRFVEQRLSA